MKFLRLIFVVSILAGGMLSAVAQSGGGAAGGGGKKTNSRPAPVATAVPPIVPSPLETTADDGDVIRVSTQIVSVPVRVMDRKGRFIAGVKRDEFRVTENGVEQEIAYFSNEEEPFTVVLMLDMSYSSTFKIGEIQSAAVAFIDQLRPVDKVAVVSFNQDVHVLCGPTADRKEIYKAIRSTKIDTGTSLYEAMDVVIRSVLNGIEGRKAVILFSDGVDTTSRRSTDMTNLADAMELDALVYPIRYDTFADVQRMKNGGPMQRPVEVPPVENPAKPRSTMDVILGGLKSTATASEQGTTAEEYKRAAEYMQGLADRTGGRLYEASTITNLGEAYSRIASELREFYSIGYYPKDDRQTGRRATVKVRVARENVVVRSREEFIRRKKDAVR